MTKELKMSVPCDLCESGVEDARIKLIESRENSAPYPCFDLEVSVFDAQQAAQIMIMPCYTIRRVILRDDFVSGEWQLTHVKNDICVRSRV